MLNLGIIGYGGRAGGVISEILKTGEVRIAAITDIRNDEIKEKLDAEGYTDIRYYTDADMMIKSEKLDGVFVGTRCSMHTHFALLVAKYGLPLFLEKPVSTTDEDLMRLEGILPEMNEKTVVSFPLRLTTLCRKVKEIVASGKLGRIEHIQAYNNDWCTFYIMFEGVSDSSLLCVELFADGDYATTLYCHDITYNGMYNVARFIFCPGYPTDVTEDYYLIYKVRVVYNGQDVPDSRGNAVSIFVIEVTR